ncbi:MAG: thioredoxin family protein [Monoglobales bacterium]
MKKNIDRQEACCCCCDSAHNVGAGIGSIKVIERESGGEQFENVKAAAKKMGLEIEVEHITDGEKAERLGVTGMPAIVVNEKVAAMGKLLSAEDVEELLSDY